MLGVMNLLINALTIASLLAFSIGLVHHIQMTYSDGSCSGSFDGSPFKLWEFKQGKDMCGGVMCHNEKGDTLIYYCQKLPFFLDCTIGRDLNLIDTTIDFPECCWHCIRAGLCDQKPTESSGKLRAVEDGTADGKEENEYKPKPDNKSNKISGAKPNDKYKKEDKKKRRCNTN